MSLSWIDADTPLPDASQALPGGLVAVGADLSTTRLAEAYAKGLFPWYNPGDPVLWWSPDPRMVLPCAALRLSHSLAKRLRQIARNERLPDPAIRVTLNTAFGAVIRACAHRTQTWITPDIMAVYEDWHRQGHVHSIETWVDDKLAGGLYGVGLQRFFFGESMFSHVANTSKIALVYLVRYLQAWHVPYIDCQQDTAHMASMGAAPIPRTQFLSLLSTLQAQPGPAWGRGQLLSNGQLIAH
ncbi:leucyl/phenylalanyl-tRNA--protein transferase [Alcaligenaceae bacterium CGII-47]|nr:leucyl/phenylalanyl-tRNA--protein transferase [Alcaligenaceae bacterium CGII-47]